MKLFSKCSFFSYSDTTCTFPDMGLTWCLFQTHSGEILNTCYNVLQIRVTSLNTCYNCQKRGWQCHIFHFITSSAPHSFVIAFAWGESAMRCAASLVWTFILEERECFQLLLKGEHTLELEWGKRIGAVKIFDGLVSSDKVTREGEDVREGDEKQEETWEELGDKL